MSTPRRNFPSTGTPPSEDLGETLAPRAAVSTLLGQIAWRRAKQAAREAKRAQQAKDGQKKKADDAEKRRQQAKAEKKRDEEPGCRASSFSVAGSCGKPWKGISSSSSKRACRSRCIPSGFATRQTGATAGPLFGCRLHHDHLQLPWVRQDLPGQRRIFREENEVPTMRGDASRACLDRPCRCTTPPRSRSNSKVLLKLWRALASRCPFL